MILVDTDHGAGRSQALEHSVSPAAVPVLQRLYDLQFQVDVHLKAFIAMRAYVTVVLGACFMDEVRILNSAALEVIKLHMQLQMALQ